jgi:hypothetical protein
MNVFIFPQVPRPAVPTPTKAALHPALREFHDFRISYFMRERTGEVVPLWNLVNHVVALDRPASEQECRRITLLVLERVKALLKGGFLSRWGRKHVTLAGTVTEKPPRRYVVRRRRKRLSRAQTPIAPPVRAPVAAEATAQNTCEQHQPAVERACAEHPCIAAGEKKTESVTHGCIEATTREQLAAAASQMAKLPRKRPRTWTGWIGGSHCWRGRKVILPDGRVEEVYAAHRGLVGLAIPQSGNFHPRELLFRADQLRLWSHPAAVALGQAKHGVKERPSLKKAEAARRNGCCPPRSGSRPRGRPRMDAP